METKYRALLFKQLNELLYNLTEEKELRYLINLKILDFKYLIKHELNLTEDEFKEIKFEVDINNSTVNLKNGNLFTACLMYDKYVPLVFIYREEALIFESDDTETIFEKGRWIESRIFYNIDIKDWVFEKIYEEVKDELQKNEFKPSFKIEKGKIYNMHVDGNFTIEYINDEVWVTPKTHCFQKSIN